ncbi:MAG: DUF2332 domain-containing protein [Actinomycetota bacterium]
MSDVRESLKIQADGCRRLGSVQYADLLDAMVLDHDRGGPISTLLASRTDRPGHDALPLRLLGVVHRAALDGHAPELAARFPSCGGDGGAISLTAVYDAIARLGSLLDDALGRGVQTNEVGRSLCHLTVANWLPSLGIDEFDWWEVGASAGLNLSFDRYAANTGHGILGQEGSSLTFPSSMFANPPLVNDPARCIERLGCDPDPVDLECDSVRLESFVWPDQVERRSRLLAAIAITRPLRHRVDPASADEWIAERLADSSDRPAVVFHSIVWQYMASEVRARFRDSLTTAGSRGRHLVWARMEPAGEKADLRADVWSNGTVSRYHLADVGYHGQNFDWLERHLSD